MTEQEDKPLREVSLEPVVNDIPGHKILDEERISVSGEQDLHLTRTFQYIWISRTRPPLTRHLYSPKSERVWKIGFTLVNS
jgi:hypothetical protein